MQSKIWYGAKNNETVFARNENSLSNHGIDNPRSFTVNGDVQGLKLIDDQSQQSQSGTAQTS
jgi:hypothetical protein